MFAAAALYILCGLGKAACTGLGNLPSVYSTVGLGTLLHSRLLDWRMVLKHYTLNRSHCAPFWGWNILLFSVQPSPLVDLWLTICTLNTADCILSTHYETALMFQRLIAPQMGFFFPDPVSSREHRKHLEQKYSAFPCIADGVFKAHSGLCGFLV